MIQKISLLLLFIFLPWYNLVQAQAPENIDIGPQAPAIVEPEDSGETNENIPEKKKKKKKKKNPHAHLPQYEIIVGQPLPPLFIEEYGEVIIVDEVDIRYQPWSSDTALNRVQLIHYLAGRRSASKRQKNFSDQLEALELDFKKHHVTTIVNSDDAFLGTSKLVASRLDNSKREYPQISVVGDKIGLGAHIWSLKRKGSAIIIVGADGTVIFFKQDKFSQQEIDTTLELLQSHMAP
jgi:YtfJ family uncharacterized protein